MYDDVLFEKKVKDDFEETTIRINFAKNAGDRFVKELENSKKNEDIEVLQKFQELGKIKTILEKRDVKPAEVYMPIKEEEAKIDDIFPIINTDTLKEKKQNRNS